jgi:hypothetical protein
MENSRMPTREQTKLDGSVLTEKVWNRLRHNGKLVRDEVTSHLPPMLRSLTWQEFQQMPMAAGPAR